MLFCHSVTDDTIIVYHIKKLTLYQRQILLDSGQLSLATGNNYGNMLKMPALINLLVVFIWRRKGLFRKKELL